MTVSELTAVTINLEGDCSEPTCAVLIEQLYAQLSNGNYRSPCSVMSLPDSIDAWASAHRTARRRANQCANAGYTFRQIDWSVYEDDVYAINTSKAERQGRAMSPGYREHPHFEPLPNYPCLRHRFSTYGVLDESGVLRAYTWVYRCGDLVLFSTILGHAEHLTRHVMYLLFRSVLDDQIRYGPGVAFYNRHDSGTDGLRFFKDRCGFRPATIEWVRA